MKLINLLAHRINIQKKRDLYKYIVIKIFSKTLKESRLKSKEPIVLCLLKNGSYFIPSFMEHYKKLGFNNFVFLDNSSNDDSLQKLKKYDVCIIVSKLKYKKYKWAFKQFLVKKYAKTSWSLYVDIDELWDYPYSSRISLSKFFHYLDKKNFNAVQGQMLDMFGDHNLINFSKKNLESLKESYPYYNNKDLIIKKYTKSNNRINNLETKHFWGGIHKTAFNIDNIYLSKIPLIKWSKHISVHETSHTSSHVNIADVSTLLLHYKFVYGFFKKANKIILDENYWNTSETYKKYIEVLKKKKSINLKSKDSKKYIKCENLVDEGFLMISKSYIKLLNKY